MRSKSKYEVDHQTVKQLFSEAGIEGAENIAPLGAGEFNSVYSVDAGGKAYAIKIEPADTSKTLTYEKNMMEQELYYYSLMGEKAGISIPRIYHQDLSRQSIPAGYFIMDRLEGSQSDEADLPEEKKEKANEKLVAMVASMHTVKGERFGYRQNGLHDNWYLALHSMIKNLISDCRKLRMPTPRGKKLLKYVELNKEILEKVECSLINFDIWPPNIFIHQKDDEIQMSWIDPERCLWGDRIADFVCLDFMNMSLDSKASTLKAYNRASDNPIDLGDEERIRLAIMLGYLGLIMEVEKYARYSLFHFGYWRNISVCKMLFKSCFSQLEKLTVEK